MRSRPLGSYLKALGLLRVVSRQLGGGARARWRRGILELRLESDHEHLRTFLLEAYQPTPIVSPWNGGSGFFPKDNKAAFSVIEGSTHMRTAPWRRAIESARAVLDEQGIGAAPKSDAKIALLQRLRATLPDEALEWLDAAVVLLGREVAYPPVLGSGGNDGRYDFSNNYAQAIVMALGLGDPPEDGVRRASLLDAALDGRPVALEKLSTAHFGRDASPVNSPVGEADALANPWDLVLAVEGSLLLTAGAVRRHDAGLERRLVAAFTVRPTGAGYGSAVPGEGGREELWLPLWSGWSALSELESMMREARAQVGRRSASSGLDFARAAGELGVARGVAAFERYAILERAGQSSLAVSAGRIEVRPRPSAQVLQSIDQWLQRSLAVASGLPRAAVVALRRLERAAFSFANEPDPLRCCAVLEALGAAETAFSRSGARAQERGLVPLRRADAAPWVQSANDGTAEFTVATRLASLRDPTRRSLPALRDYLHGTGRDARGWRSYAGEIRVAVPAHGGAAARLAALHARRHLDARNAGGIENATPSFERGLWCPRGAACDFAAGRLDDARILRLLGGLALLDYQEVPRAPSPAGAHGPPVPAFELLALAWEGIEALALAPRAGWAAQLAAGAQSSVFADAILRLRLAQVSPLVTAEDLAVGCPSGERLAAALLLRLGPASRRRLATQLLEADIPASDQPVSKEGAHA